MPAATDAHARLANDFGCTRCSPPGQRCGLKFGLFFSKAPSKSHLLDAADYLTVWLGTHSRKFGNGFNPYWHGRMLERVRAQNSTAVFYSYIIAMLARHKSGIRDCDMGSPNLCEHGAQFVRRNEGPILELYEQYANHTARWLGRSAAVVWLMEPDWHQYHESTQRGGGLPQGQMVGLFRQMIARIKRHLPSSRISFDVSPWVVNQREWISPFLQHAQIDFLHTSGGRTTAGSTRVRGNERGNLVTWSELYKVSGRGIIADTGYGVGGKLTTNDDGWSDVANLRARVSDGLVAVTYANVGATWSHKLSRLRRTLPPTKHCFGNSMMPASRHGPQRNGSEHQRKGLRPVVHYSHHTWKEKLPMQDTFHDRSKTNRSVSDEKHVGTGSSAHRSHRNQKDSRRKEDKKKSASLRNITGQPSSGSAGARHQSHRTRKSVKKRSDSRRQIGMSSGSYNSSSN